MKTFFFLLGFCLICFAGLSQNIIYKKDWQGNLIAVDERGNTLATQKKDWQGNPTWVDSKGNIINTQKKDWQGNNIWVDNQGNLQRTEKKDWQGNRVLENSRGEAEYIYKKDWQGNTIIEDKNGNLIGTYKKDWQGNPVFEQATKFNPASNGTTSSPYDRRVINIPVVKPFDAYGGIIEELKEESERFEEQLRQQKLMHPGKDYYSDYGWLSPSEYQVKLNDENITREINNIKINAYVEHLSDKYLPASDKLDGWKKVSVLPYSYNHMINNVESLIYFPTWYCKFKKGKLIKIEEYSGTTRIKDVYDNVDAVGKYVLRLGKYQTYLLICKDVIDASRWSK